MGSDAKSKGPLTILSLCDVLQQKLMDNGMVDAPVLVSEEGGTYSYIDQRFITLSEVDGVVSVVID